MRIEFRRVCPFCGKAIEDGDETLLVSVHDTAGKGVQMTAHATCVVNAVDPLARSALADLRDRKRGI